MSEINPDAKSASKAGKELPRESAESLVSQVRRMLMKEAYHYCADCHTHCRQTILTVEALKELQRQTDALVETARLAAIILAGRAAGMMISVKEAGEVNTKLRAALALAASEIEGE